MKNYVQEGRSLDFVAPVGGVVAGLALLSGVLLVVPATTAAEAMPYSGAIEGVYELPAATSQAWTTIGAALYWDDTNKRLTTTASGNTKIGVVAAVKGSADTVGRVKLTPNA